MSSDTWVSEHETLEIQSVDLFQKINARNQLPKFGVQYTRADAEIASLRKKFDDKVINLQQRLVQAATKNLITRSESDRRQKLLDTLTTKSRQMESSLKDPNAFGRSTLLASVPGGSGSNGASGGGNPWSDEDDTVPASHNLTNDDFRNQHKTLFKEQDRGLDILDEIITRQKGIARGIATEIDTQNEILDDIGDNMDQTNQRLIRNTRNIKKISLKSDTCFYWIVIIGLFVGIVVVACL
jgi:hypothetical protein